MDNITPLDYTFNDGGRAAAGYKGTTDDCVVRSIVIASGYLDYQDVYDELFDLTKKWANAGRTKEARAAASHPDRLSPRHGVAAQVYRPFVEHDLGWEWTPTMGIGTGTTVHLRRGELPKTDDFLLVRCSKHLTTVCGDTVYDNHDPTRGGTRAVYGYWRT